MDPQDPFDPAHFAIPVDWKPPEQPRADRAGKVKRRRQRKEISADEYFSVASWLWLATAAKLPGKALHVGLVLWHLRNLSGSQTIRWQPIKAREFGLSRQVAYRGLAAIEAAGLATVERRVGRCPRVTIVEVERVEKKQSTEDEAIQ